ncbi:hypothetical protein CVO77_01625 [Sphingopyxis lindanitolerans]|uniref:Uncharacterized protein n=1 Tax=Sphingopyxis lindanitolerans TaxID=2054227 RepID=A0A2S8B4K3_9SPHN|nr:hypothetical protein [Sphingopyxis lindanitolerans]PQM27334.1 hypothetical protein CVO77_01625 [Sphingopyxis lindanitolerans]
MLTFIVLLAAATEPVSDDPGMNAIPIDYTTVGPADIQIPVSASVRAETWDHFIIKPSEPHRVRVACIVLTEVGVPGACVPESFIAPGKKTIDWVAARSAYEKAFPSDDPAEAALYFAASQRMNAVRVTPRPDSKSMFAIRIFEETISPTDARPPFTPGESLGTLQVTITRPPDGRLMGMLYPTLALRNSVEAEIRMTCRIEADFSLLCRDPGQIALRPADAGDQTADLIEDFRFSTYQLASTMRLGPKTIDGRDAVGRDLRIRIAWKLPSAD